MTHDYKRQGTMTLFAALCRQTGCVISTCMPRHCHQEWTRFLNPLDQEVPSGVEVHLVCDNYATHMYEKVKRWVTRRLRFHVHYTLTSASTSTSLHHNDNPKHFIWTQKASDILEKVTLAGESVDNAPSVRRTTPSKCVV